MKRLFPRLLAVLLIGLAACQSSNEETPPATDSTANQEQPKPVEYTEQMKPELSLDQANRLAGLPLKCIQNPMPYKSGIVLASEKDLAMPKEHHPAFYGCFDWHSAVHGHWVLVNLLKHFPELDKADEIRAMLDQNLTAENIQTEIAYFSLNDYSKSFERTYGWAWLLKLSEELYTWDDDDARRWYANLKPLADVLVDKYGEYLPKLNYPIRVGTHTNTAFGLTFAWDYCQTVGEQDLSDLIAKRARDFYFTDEYCPVTWEPSGYDFLSPCLEEADIMRRVLEPSEFQAWFMKFLPELVDVSQDPLEPARVSDRSDGHLVHLDGLNFSRAWCLYPIARDFPDWAHLADIADEHVTFSLPNIVDGDYAGEHWLGSFALFALNSKN